MRTIAVLLLLGLLVAALPATVRAGTPSVPSVTTSTTWVATPAIPATTSIPYFPPTQSYVPFSSPPYSSWLPCIGDVVTAFALDYCGSLTPVESQLPPVTASTTSSTATTTTTTTSSPPTTTSSCPTDSICVAGAAGICWSGTATAPYSFINGCGNMTYTYTGLTTGSMIGAAVSPNISTPGTLSLTANCGGSPPFGYSTDTTSPPQSGPVATCTVP
jgi:hypothetical protein